MLSTVLGFLGGRVIIPFWRQKPQGFPKGWYHCSVNVGVITSCITTAFIMEIIMTLLYIFYHLCSTFYGLDIYINPVLLLVFYVLVFYVLCSSKLCSNVLRSNVLVF